MTNLSLHHLAETPSVARGLLRLAVFVTLFVTLTAVVALVGG